MFLVGAQYHQEKNEEKHRKQKEGLRIPTNMMFSNRKKHAKVTPPFDLVTNILANNDQMAYQSWSCGKKEELRAIGTRRKTQLDQEKWISGGREPVQGNVCLGAWSGTSNILPESCFIEAPTSGRDLYYFFRLDCPSFLLLQIKCI